jgi:hypothetical protein
MWEREGGTRLKIVLVLFKTKWRTNRGQDSFSDVKKIVCSLSVHTK